MEPNIEREEIAKALEESFNRPQKYKSLTVRAFRKALALLPEEYDECDICFAFLVKDYGETEEKDGNHNFIVGNIPIKSVVRHPDQPRVMLCDDASMDYFYTKTNVDKTNL